MFSQRKRPRRILWFVLSLYAVSFCFIFPILFNNLGFSLFYNSLIAEENTVKENAERAYKAIEYINGLDETSHYIYNKEGRSRTDKKPRHEYLCHEGLPYTNLKASRNLSICMVVVSVYRSEDNYLIQVVAKLLKEINKASAINEKLNYEVLIYNGDYPNTKNKDAIFIQNLTSRSRPITVCHQEQNTSSSNKIHPYEKEKRDYLSAMELCMARGAHYTLVIEDDALPVNGFLNTLDYILKYKLLHSQLFLFLKLYYPERWQGFGKEEIKELFIGGFSVGLIFSLIILKLCKIEFKRCTVSNYMIVLFLAASLSGYCILTAYTFGRQHILELFKFSKVTHFLTEAPGCCTPAVLYPHYVIRPLIEYLNSVTCRVDFPLDIALDTFGREKNLQRYLIVPNLFYHIGYHSSIKDNNKDPREFQFLISPTI